MATIVGIITNIQTICLEGRVTAKYAFCRDNAFCHVGLLGNLVLCMYYDMEVDYGSYFLHA